MLKFLKNREQLISTLIFGIGVVVIGILVWGSTNISIWQDEVFQLRMIDHPYAYFLTKARDAAPPFHFAILKTFVMLAGFIFPNIHYISVAKFSSVLAYIIIFAVSNIIVRKNFGAIAGSLSGLLCMTMPVLFTYGLEFRMYAWSITIAFLWFVAFYNYLEHETIVNAVVITVVGTLGVFTHYYVAFGVAYAYIILFIYCLIKKRYKSAVRIVGVSLGSAVLFSPWLAIAFKRVVKIANNFWLPEVKKEEVVQDFFFPIKPDVSQYGMDKIGALIFGIIIIFFLVRLFFGEKDNKSLLTMIGLTMPFAVAIIGILIGKYVFSVFQPRYIMVVMACFWMAFSIAVGNLKSHKYIQILILLFLLSVAFLDVSKHTKEEMRYADNIEVLCNFLESHDGAIVIDDGRTFNCLPYYTDRQVLSVTGDDNDYELILDMISNREKVYLFHSNMSNVDLSYAAKLEEDGVSCKLVENCGIEYVLLEVYELSR